jgi:hypothetical protein
MRRLVGALQLLSGSLAGALVVLYVLGRILTDRTYVTQYIFWTPWPAYVFAVALLAGMAWLCGRPARRRRERRRRAWTWRLPGIALVLMLAHVGIVECHVWRYILPARRAPAAKTLRVMHWNMTYAYPYWWDRFIAAVLKAPRPDILIVTNPTLEDDLPQLAAALGPDYRAIRCGMFGIFSRAPVRERDFSSLTIPAQSGVAAPSDKGEPVPETDFLPDWSPIPRIGSNVYDPGHAMCVQIDTTEQLGRPIVIWAIDMPSQPRGWRMAMARAARARLDFLAESTDSDPPRSRHWPLPDLILGDFNTPRGSASLDLLARGYPHAFDQTGRGQLGSWPRGFPLFHIDHVFVGPQLRATSYHTYNLGLSEHRAQSAEITTR